MGLIRDGLGEMASEMAAGTVNLCLVFQPHSLLPLVMGIGNVLP